MKQNKPNKSSANAATAIAPRKKGRTLIELKKQLSIQGFALAGIIYLILFSIIPMAGIIIAFNKYDIRDGFMGMFTAPWVGFDHFVKFVGDRKFSMLMTNTITISALKLICSFPLPILLAIMITEMRGKYYKRVVQTVSYLPHFINWIVVSGICFAFFSTQSGLVNEILIKTGLADKPIPILLDPKYYYGLAVLSDIWKETGWGAILYLATISGIDPSLYESAQIDGAGRLKRIWYITLPSLKGIIIIMLILSVGGLVGGNFDQSMMLGNDMNRDKSMIIEYYVFTVGLGQGKYSYAAAVGLFQSVISLTLTGITAKISNKYSEVSLF